MKQKFNIGFNSSLLLVRHKSDLEKPFSEDTVFLVYKDEWRNSINGEIELLTVKIDNNAICLYPAPNNGMLISKAIPYSSKGEYIEI